ncbi:MAG: hypothetical protein ABR499_15885 [Gemmatimonadaceae bacterium]
MPDVNETPDAQAGQPLPRAFTDSLGATWTVREITPGPMPEKLSQMLGQDRRRGGWLLFLSDKGEKRRLSPVPQGWAGFSEDDLEAWCMRARRVPPAPARRSEDREPEA